MQLGPHSRARARPQTAAASTYRGRGGTGGVGGGVGGSGGVATLTVAAAAPADGLTGFTRPPTRQKPPPVSLRLENNGRSSEMMKPLETALEEEGFQSEAEDEGNVQGLSSGDFSD